MATDLNSAESTRKIELPWLAAARPQLTQQQHRPTFDAVKVLSVYVCLLLLVPSTLALPGLGAVGTLANVWALVALLWYIGSWMVGRIVPAPGTRAPRRAMIFFGATILLSYIAAAQRAPGSLELNAADRSLLQLVAWIGVVVLASAGIRNYGRLDQLMRLLVRCGAIVGALGVFEFFTRIDVVGLVPGLSAAPAGGLMARGDFVRPLSTTIHPLEYGAVMTLLLPFAIQQAFDAGRRGRVRRWMKVALIASSLPLTVSRTSVIGAVIVFAVLIPTWKPQRRVRTLMVLGVGMVLMKIAVPGLIGTLNKLFSSWFSGTDTSTTARTVRYTQIAQYISERPWSGMGFQTFLPVVYIYTDNQYLLALLEIGIVGTVALVGLFFVMMHCGGAGRRRMAPEYQKELGQSFVAGSLVTLVASVTFDTFSFPMFAGVFFLLLGCSGAYYGIAKQQVAQTGRGDLSTHGTAPDGT